PRDARRPVPDGGSTRDGGPSQLRLRTVARASAVSLNGDEPLPVGRSCAAVGALQSPIRGRIYQPPGSLVVFRHRVAPPHARARLPVGVVPQAGRGAPGLSRAPRQVDAFLAGHPLTFLIGISRRSPHI